MSTSNKTRSPSLSSLVEATTTGKKGKFCLQVSSPKFVLVWWMLLLFHLTDMCFLIGSQWLYQWLLHGGSYASYLLSCVRMDLNWSTLDMLSYGFVGLAGLHGLVVGRTLWASLQARRLLFTSSLTPIPTTATRDGVHIQLQSARVIVGGTKGPLGSHYWVVQQGYRQTLSIYARVMTQCIHPFLSIDGKYFDLAFLVQELIEVASQVYQAYRSSVFIATRWINHLIVAMVFLNCLSTPVIHWVIPVTKAPMRRFVSVLVSCLLNFVNCVVVPLVIFLPYVVAYDPRTQYFDFSLVWNDVWWVQAMSENEQVFVTSWLDYFTTLLPHGVILSCLLVCESMLQRQRRSITSVTVVPGSLVRQSTSLSSAITKVRATYTKTEVFLHALLLVSGFVVLGLHVASQSPNQLDGCRLQGTPWLGVNNSCVVMNINCHRRGIEGNQEEIHSILTQLSSDTLVSLIITHCPRLQIPTSFRTLQHLQVQVLEIYNCTLDRWEANASVRQQDMSSLNLMTISRSVLSPSPEGAMIPEGLLDEAMARMEIEMILYQTNVTTLPPSVAQVWASIPWFWCDSCQLQRFPWELSSAIQLTLPNNPIASLVDSDDNLFVSHPALYLLDLSGTAITALPTNTTNHLESLCQLSLERTLLQEVPVYIRQWYAHGLEQGLQLQHSLYGSPYCATIIDPHDREQIVYQKEVCGAYSRQMSHGFPIQVIEPQRSL